MNFLVIVIIFCIYQCRALTGKGFGKKIDGFPYTGRQRPGVLSPKREVPVHIPRPEYASSGKPNPRGADQMIKNTKEDIELMRVAGRLAREVLDIAISSVKSGMTTDEIDHIVHEATIARDCYPSPLNYNKFPKSCCTSINEVICHGIPDTTTKLLPGDIINIDITVFYNGVHGDCSETAIVDGPQAASEELRDLVKTTYESLQKGIEFCKPGRKYSDIGGIIEGHIKKKGYSSVEDFCGHG